MNINKRNHSSLWNLKEYLDVLEGLKNFRDLHEYLGYLELYNISHIFSLFINPDFRNNKINIVH